MYLRNNLYYTIIRKLNVRAKCMRLDIFFLTYLGHIFTDDILLQTIGHSRRALKINKKKNL